PIAIVLAHHAYRGILGAQLGEPRPRTACHPKRPPHFARALAVEPQGIMRGRAALTLTFGARTVFRGPGIHEYAPALEAQFETQGIRMRMGGQVVRPDGGDIADEVERRQADADIAARHQAANTGALNE